MILNGFLFNGLFLFIQKLIGSGGGPFLLQEDGFYLLQEDGNKLILEV